MKSISKEFTDHQNSGATTLAYCLKLIRNDGKILGFTNHDNQITINGITYEENNAIQSSEISTSTGLKVDNLDILGIIDSETLLDNELASGLYDNAKIEITLVNWQEPQQNMLLFKGNIGEVTRSDISFKAEVRGLSHYLNQPSGRIYQTRCDAYLGDNRCKIDLNSENFAKQAKVSKIIDKRKFITSQLTDFSKNWFFKGKLKWLSGLNINSYFEIKNSHKLNDTDTLIELWQGVNNPMSINDEFKIYAGCNKTISQCREKFSNTINFRGFPHIPGNNFITYYPKPK